ncbi:MAG: FadR/GntR family transcriptional regulator [Bacillota bacterium]|nr:FadR/GntR family transcriptional regulator [Bacillota bacterium]
MSVKPSLAERAANEIFAMISGSPGYQEGEKLPNEGELGQILGVSRTTLREAIRLLVARGILEVRRGTGTFVTSRARLSGDMGLSQLEAVRIRLNDLFELRMMFEPQTAALACLRANEEELSDIQAKAEKVEKNIHSGGNWAEADQELHNALAMASHNQFMCMLLPIITNAISDTWHTYAENAALADMTLADNRLILNALMNRDHSGCRYAMALHIHHTIIALGLGGENDVLF